MNVERSKCVSACCACALQVCVGHALYLRVRSRVNCWIPNHLTKDNKSVRKRTCEELLKMYDDDYFLPLMITVDEKWVY